MTKWRANHRTYMAYIALLSTCEAYKLAKGVSSKYTKQKRSMCMTCDHKSFIPK